MWVRPATITGVVCVPVAHERIGVMARPVVDRSVMGDELVYSECGETTTTTIDDLNDRGELEEIDVDGAGRYRTRAAAG